MKTNIFKMLDECTTRMDQTLRSAPWNDASFYAAWLAQTTYYVRHSTRLLALAGAHASQEEQEFHLRFLKHAEEEKGHEKLTLLDLKHLGKKIDVIPEFAATQSLYQTQYYWIEKISPLAFFGYILCLENIAMKVGPVINKTVEQQYGPKGAHFWRVHAEEDVDHVAEAIRRVESLPVETQQLILANMIQSFENYTAMIKSCMAYAKGENRELAA